MDYSESVNLPLWAFSIIPNCKIDTYIATISQCSGTSPIHSTPLSFIFALGLRPLVTARLMMICLRRSRGVDHLLLLRYGGVYLRGSGVEVVGDAVCSVNRGIGSSNRHYIYPQVLPHNHFHVYIPLQYPITKHTKNNACMKNWYFPICVNKPNLCSKLSHHRILKQFFTPLYRNISQYITLKIVNITR